MAINYQLLQQNVNVEPPLQAEKGPDADTLKLAACPSQSTVCLFSGNASVLHAFKSRSRLKPAPSACHPFLLHHVKMLDTLGCLKNSLIHDETVIVSPDPDPTERLLHQNEEGPRKAKAHPQVPPEDQEGLPEALPHLRLPPQQDVQVRRARVPPLKQEQDQSELEEAQIEVLAELGRCQEGQEVHALLQEKEVHYVRGIGLLNRLIQVDNINERLYINQYFNAKV
ncbi:hypothetical protein FGO68_gene526 [Halteria grandinella]|uniref:Uncharacterized protein n=1 Tax=Halteria grandinella TaxID=5974 RepID=A0A8J8NNA2_HALGN|nr:hypothetical protein FGO68_gene526 [Halteria grandinella]